jgi:hypothetical protein
MDTKSDNYQAPAGALIRATEDHLNSLLADWHQWRTRFSAVAAYGRCSMWDNSKSSRQWDAECDVLDSYLNHVQMASFDFEVQQLRVVYQTALQINARNLYTGHSVWRSARMPTNRLLCAQLVEASRAALVKRLLSAGVM